ncbi:MAG: hypothetical protein ACXAC2_00285 [Candidatus Kariarchaeaceae archaeon]
MTFVRKSIVGITYALVIVILIHVSMIVLQYFVPEYEIRMDNFAFIMSFVALIQIGGQIDD